MSETDFSAAAEAASVFARIEPDTKRRLIAALQARGHYVAMTGDGVNDVPALKQANLAIVMNDGAQISKDVGDIVLLNNAMSTLPLAFREGRAITQTIFGTSKLFLVKNFYSLLFFIFAGFMAMPFPINPIQISWITFGIINVPATLIAFRVLKPAYMQRFRADVLDYVITAGFIGAVAMSILYAAIYIGAGHHMELARSAITLFLTLFGLQVLLNTQGIEWTRPSTIAANKGIFALGIVLTVVTLIVPYILPYVLPGMARSFRFVPPTPPMLLLIAGLFLLSALLIEIAARTKAIVSRIWALAAP
jgi:cation-transporting ATPase E